MSNPNASESLIYGYCYDCCAERPVRGSVLESHAGRDGIRCPQSGKRPGYYCSAPESPDEEIKASPGGGRRS